MEREDILYSRVDEANTETPRVCHILAITFAGLGMKIPDGVKKAVLSSAERGRAELGELIDTINLLSGPGLSPDLVRNNFLDLAGKISTSYGIDGPLAGERRLDYIRDALYKDEVSGEGVGFTE